ncbi:MAG TPA: hypothetical protein DD490_21635 [Acidobacteria bacterium]|nr:hypothetical protein [Acidobacteriota bacterium]
MTDISRTRPLPRVACSAALLVLLGSLDAAGPARAAVPKVVTEAEAGNASGGNDSPAAGSVIDMSTGRAVAIGALGAPGDVDYWKVSVPAGARIIALCDTGGAPIEDDDSTLTLFGTDGITLIEQDEDDGTGNGGDLQVEATLASVIAGPKLSTSGTYYLQVKHWDGTAVISRYALHVALITTNAVLEDGINDTPATADPLVAPGAQLGARNGVIADTDDQNTADDDFDYYSIASNPGDTLFVALDGDPSRDGINSLNVSFDLLDAGNNLLMTVENTRGVDVPGPVDGYRGDGVTLTVATNPTYVRVFSSNSADEGSYRILAATHAFPVASTSFYTVSPCRLTDTRTTLEGRMVSGEARVYGVGGVCGVPETATAVVLNVSVVNPSTAGSLVTWADHLPKPGTLIVSFPANVTRSSLAIVPLSIDGFATLQARGDLQPGATFDLAVDVTGYFAP